MKKALMIVAIVVLVAIAGSMVYYFVFFKPDIQRQDLAFQKSKYETEQKQKQEELKNIEQEKIDNEQADINKKINIQNALTDLDKWYKDALTQAYNDYSAQWETACKNLGLKFISPSESPLPNDIAKTLTEYLNQATENIQESYQSQKDDIYKLYE